MKKLRIVSSLIVLSFALSMLVACGSDAIKDDLKSYVNDKLPAAQTLETASGTAFNAVAGNNYKDDATMLASLNDTVIPSINSAIDAANKIAPSTKEVAALNTQYVTALTSYSTAYTTLKDALVNADKDKATEATTLLATAETQKGAFLDAVKALEKDHGLTEASK